MFVSVTKGKSIAPGLVKIVLDGEMLVQHSYTDREIDALQQGGVHRLYVGQLARGDHTFEASLSGTETKGGDFRRKAKKDFFRRLGPTYVELRVNGTRSKEEPEFSIDVW